VLSIGWWITAKDKIFIRMNGFIGPQFVVLTRQILTLRTIEILHSSLKQREFCYFCSYILNFPRR
jgi:hypothetical protein